MLRFAAKPGLLLLRGVRDSSGFARSGAAGFRGGSELQVSLGNYARGPRAVEGRARTAMGLPCFASITSARSARSGIWRRASSASPPWNGREAEVRPALVRAGARLCHPRSGRLARSTARREKAARRSSAAAEDDSSSQLYGPPRGTILPRAEKRINCWADRGDQIRATGRNYFLTPRRVGARYHRQGWSGRNLAHAIDFYQRWADRRPAI